MRSIASLTSWSAWLVGFSILKRMEVTELPSVTVDMMSSTPSMPATASSISFVTCTSSSAGAAPLCVTVTATTGTSILGNRVMGSE